MKACRHQTTQLRGGITGNLNLKINSTLNNRIISHTIETNDLKNLNEKSKRVRYLSQKCVLLLNNPKRRKSHRCSGKRKVTQNNQKSNPAKT